MAWDPSRPVPWKRMLTEWLISAALLGLAFVLLFDNASTSSIVIGLAASGPIYFLFGFVMAKFGYQRTSLRDARANAQAARSGSTPASTSNATARPKPAPTKRTGGAQPRRR